MLIAPITRKIFSNIREARKIVIHKINPERYQYILKGKTGMCKVSKLKNFGLPIPEGADTFTMVHIGKRDDDNYSKVITTFYKNNQITRRYINDCGEVTARVYSHLKANLDSGIKTVFRTVKTVRDNGGDDVELQKIEHIELTKIPHRGRVKYKMHRDVNIFDGSSITAQLKEHENLPYRKLSKCDIEMNIELDKDGIPHIINQSATEGISLSGNDEFLPYRFIFDHRKQRLAFTKYFLKKYHLENLGIKIDDTKNLEGKYIGEFCAENRLLQYDKDYTSALELAAHEVRHAYQYAQIGRLGKGYGEYYRDAEKQLGKIQDPKEAQEAYKFLVAAEKYPSEADIAKNYRLYTDNYLEIDARNAESEAMTEYSKGARLLAALIGRYI